MGSAAQTLLDDNLEGNKRDAYLMENCMEIWLEISHNNHKEMEI